MICRATIKKSLKRGLWQIKEENHDITSLSSAYDVINKCMFLSGIDTSDRRLVHWLTFSDEEFPDFQIKLERKGSDFYIVDHPDFSGKGGFPIEMFRYFKFFPAVMYISIEKAGYNINKHGIEVVDLDD